YDAPFTPQSLRAPFYRFKPPMILGVQDQSQCPEDEHFHSRGEARSRSEGPADEIDRRVPGGNACRDLRRHDAHDRGQGRRLGGGGARPTKITTPSPPGLAWPGSTET